MRFIVQNRSARRFAAFWRLFRMAAGTVKPQWRRRKSPRRALPKGYFGAPPTLGAGRALARAIDADPARRFADAADFRQALEQGLLHGSLQNRRPRLRRDSLALWRALTAILAAALLLPLVKGR